MRSTFFIADEIDISRLIGGGQAYPHSDCIQEGGVIKEVSKFCVLLPDANMTRLKNVNILLPLFVEKGVLVTDTMINQAKQLAWVLTGLAKQVFKCRTESLHLFRDINGRKLAHSSDLYYLILVCL